MVSIGFVKVLRVMPRTRRRDLGHAIAGRVSASAGQGEIAKNGGRGVGKIGVVALLR